MTSIKEHDMSKSLAISTTAVILALYLTTACTGESNDTDAVAKSEPVTATEAITQEAESTKYSSDSIMNQPVDFSTPESFKMTLQNVREQEGDGAYDSLKSAMQYLMIHDLSVKNNYKNLHKKLHGRTPNEILAQAKRMGDK